MLKKKKASTPFPPPALSFMVMSPLLNPLLLLLTDSSH